MYRASTSRIPHAKHVATNTLANTPRWHVRTYGGGLAITVHNRQDNTSLGIEGADAFAVVAYYEAMRESHPTTSLDTVWAAVWRDFDMDEHAHPHRVAPIEYV